MRRFSLRAVVLLAPVLALVGLILEGCGPSTTPSESAGGGGGAGGGAGPAPKRTGLQEVENKGWGTLKGRATLDGPAPEAEIKRVNSELHDAMQKVDSKDVCLSGSEDEKTDQEWKIGKDGGVANVVVWLRPPEGHFFKVDLDNKTWKDEVDIDQPHCAFIPHVSVVFPKVMDPKTKKLKDTGQKFVLKNSAPTNHNSNYKGGAKNPGDNILLTPKRTREIPLQPDLTTPIGLSCNIHKWMNGYIWAFDHPYAAVTDKDGNYEIKHVPAGVEVEVVAWHEPNQWLTEGGAKGQKITLKEGDTTQDFKVKAK